ncbi:hypothetical protein C0581_00915 [Candidatus Parcubacteria bacterium]|nr:MAG: hypothetical protein C0581_00915 [Candidatus Parcubacteria bacterium]
MQGTQTQTKINEILEIVTFIKDNAAMQKDMDERFERVEARLDNIEERLSSLEEDVRLIKQDLRKIKKELERVELKTQKDEDATAHLYIELKGRIKKLEQKIRNIELLQQ